VMDVKVKCKDCKKEHIIKPDGLGRITSGIIFWMINMKESCCKEKGQNDKETNT